MGFRLAALTGLMVLIAMPGCATDPAERVDEVRFPVEPEYQRENLRIDLPAVGGSLSDYEAHGVVEKLRDAQVGIEQAAGEAAGGDYEHAARVEPLRVDELPSTVGAVEEPRPRYEGPVAPPTIGAPSAVTQ